jgi:hypothetical protein
MMSWDHMTLTKHASTGLSIVVCMLCVALTGCPTLQGNSTDDAGSPPDTAGPVSFGKDIQPIFDKNCGYCHRDGAIADRLGIDMHLTSGQSYIDLVNQPSADGNFILVIPGNADDSLLYLKVAREIPPKGLRMPLFDVPLRPEEIDLIREWIEDGAPNN